MAHRLRQDHPGSWHHVFARGMARRTVFEHVRDIRVFKCLLARECRRGTLQVHGLCFLTSHVHLLVRSPTGQLSQALKRVFNGFVRWFNRSRRRDGSLFRGRFGSRPVTSAIDRLNVIAYIDANPVGARLAPTPEAYAHGSATYWARGKPPPWFSTWFVAEMLGGKVPGAPGAWAAYEREFAPRRGPRLTKLIEARLARRDLEPDPLDGCMSGIAGLSSRLIGAFPTAGCPRSLSRTPMARAGAARSRSAGAVETDSPLPLRGRPTR